MAFISPVIGRVVTRRRNGLKKYRPIHGSSAIKFIFLNYLTKKYLAEQMIVDSHPPIHLFKKIF